MTYIINPKIDEDIDPFSRYKAISYNLCKTKVQLVVWSLKELPLHQEVLLVVSKLIGAGTITGNILYVCLKNVIKEENMCLGLFL